MSRKIVKICSKCHTLKPLVKHRSLCQDCNLVRKRGVAARKLATAEGAEANRQKAAVFRATPKGREYGREYAQNFSEAQVARRNELARGRYEPTPRKPGLGRKAMLAAWALTPEGRASILLQGARRRSKVYGHEIEFIDRADIAQRIAKGVCEVTGLPFDMSPPETKGAHPWAPSLDRRDSSKGYVAGNIQVVVTAYNIAKGGWSGNVLLRLARAIVDAAPKTGV